MSDHLLPITSPALQSAEQGFSVNTQRAQSADWKIFTLWCRAEEHCPLPATVETLITFITRQAVIKKIATVKRYVATIAAAHTAAGFEHPIEHNALRLALRQLSQTHAISPQPTKAINWTQIQAALQKLPDEPRSLLDKALVCVSYDTLCRRSEIVAIQVADLTFLPDGSATVYIANPGNAMHTTGTDTGTLKYLAPTTVQHLQTWLSFAGIVEGCVFKGLNRWQQVLNGPLSGEGVSRSFRRIAGITGLSLSRISAQSTRVGACHDLIRAGIDVDDIRQAGNWKTAAQVTRYAESIEVPEKQHANAMATLAALQRR